ncbi:MAG: fluoride efflux transporter CrcB [Bradymonadia bacterium]
MTALWIFIGGGIGSVLRYGLAVALKSSSAMLPVGTLAANVVGCFVLGYLASHPNIGARLGPEVHLGITVGVLGGFTTFSTFGVETVRLYESGQILYAITYILLSILGGLVAAWGGMRFA